MVSCGEQGASDNNQTEDSLKVEENTTEVETESINLAAGQEIYKSKCQVCHQLSGEGILGHFPPLTNSDFLLSDKQRAIRQTIFGSKTPITVNGIEYPGNKMSTVPMTDEQVRDVVNYILNSWGNKGGTVTLEDVKKARAKK